MAKALGQAGCSGFVVNPMLGRTGRTSGLGGAVLGSVGCGTALVGANLARVAGGLWKNPQTTPLLIYIFYFSTSFVWRTRRGFWSVVWVGDVR